jgi:uncharacterized protein (UPF0332 family)
MNQPRRQAQAKSYREKSDESFNAAQQCLKGELYRAAYNRAWYSVMQLVSAGALEKLPEEEPHHTRQSWHHVDQTRLFNKLLRKRGPLKDYQFKLISKLEDLRAWRNNADYTTPDEALLQQETANKALDRAQEIRNEVFKIIGRTQ